MRGLLFDNSARARHTHTKNSSTSTSVSCRGHRQDREGTDLRSAQWTPAGGQCALTDRWQESFKPIRRTNTSFTSPFLPNDRTLFWALTVPRLGSAAVAADVLDLLADLTVDQKRRVVVVVRGGLLLLPIGSVTRLNPGQTESSPPPLPRLLLIGHGSLKRQGVGDRSRPQPRTHHVSSEARHV